MESDLYDGHDEETGLPHAFYFSEGLDHDISLLKRSGESIDLAVLHLPDNTSSEKIKEVAEYWKGQFDRVCRYERMEGYVLLGLREDIDEEAVQESVRDISNTDVKLSKIRIHGDSSSLDELAEQF